MKKLSILFSSLLALTSISISAAFAEWSYSGKTGPEHWGELSAEYALCSAGKNQSPVNIDSKMTGNTRQKPIKLNYELMVADAIKNTGHTIQVDMRSGGVMTLDGVDYELKQFHFHMPSEHTVNGKHFPVEAHFVHVNEKGETAVLAMMFLPGKPDATLNRLWKNMPMKAGDSARLASGDLKTIESESSFSNYYSYNGSLETPPCTEGVRWIIMQSPMTISKEQFNTLKAALQGDNNRPVQPLNARLVLE